jgi:hypothetical protein
MKATPAIADAVLSRTDPETGAVSELRGLREIRQELGPIKRIGEPGKPAARALKRGSTNEATKERLANAPDGIHDEVMASYRRPRVTLPMTLLPALVNEQVQALHVARAGGRPDDPPLKRTRLDRALDHDETGSLRWALSRYVTDVLTTQESPARAEGAPRLHRSGVPFSAAQRLALGRLAHVHARLSPRDRSALDQFAVMLGARHPVLQPISMAGLGRMLRGLTDDRISEGVAVERILCLAEKLSNIYRTA